MRLREVAGRMIESDLRDWEPPEAVRFSDSQFCLVVETLDGCVIPHEFAPSFLMSIPHF